MALTTVPTCAFVYSQEWVSVPTNMNSLHINLFLIVIFSCCAQEGCGRWFPLAGELVVRGSEIVGTAGATGHAILLDCRFELPFGKLQT